MRNLMLSACLLKRYLRESAKPLWPNAWNIVLATLKSGSTFHPCFLWKYRFITFDTGDEYLIFARSYNWLSVREFSLFDIFPKQNRQIGIQFFFPLRTTTKFPYNFSVSRTIFESKRSPSSRKGRDRISKTRSSSKLFPLDYLSRLHRDTKTCPNVNNERGRDAISRTRNVVPGANGNPIMLEGRKSIKTIMQ